MKRTLKPLQQVILLTIVIMQIALLPGCSRWNGQSGEQTITALMVRHDALGSAAEVEAVLNAYDRYSTELKNNAQSANAAIGLAELFMQEARVTGEHGYYFPAAETLLKPLLARNDLKGDEKFRAFSLYAGVMASQHHFLEAKDYAQKAIAINTHNAGVRGILVDALVELGQLDQAVKACDEMVALRPDLRSYSRVSYLRERHGDLEGAIEAMKLAAAAGVPGSEQEAWCRTHLADLHRIAGRLDEAEYQLALTLEQRTDYPFALAAMADLRTAQNRDEQAEILLKKALNIIPEISFSEKLLALYTRQEQPEKVQATTAQVLEMFDDDRKHGHIIDWDLARFHAEYTGNIPAALEAANAALKTRPGHPEIQSFIAELNAQEVILAGR